MKNHVRLIFTMVYIFIAKEVFSQGTPHTIFGIVREETGNYPQATCLNFTAWIVTRPLERIVYGELGTLYQDSIWSIELSNFPTQPTTGETLVVSFSDSCENTANTITLILDMSTAYQNAGTVILYELGPPSSLTVISPNGNEMWWGGGAIQWSSAGPISYVSIYYSLDNGGNWHLITSNTPNTGIFVWDIPETTSANALVRIYSPETGIADTSDEPFVILTSPYIISPSAGEILDAGLPYTIRWNFSSYFLYVKLELSTNNGRSFSELFGVSLNDGIEIFVPPTINSDSCFIRISSVTLPIYSATSPRFSIRYTPRDTIPPATITDLQATSASSNSICLEWTAPGDDSIYGQASYYELRYNLSPITPSNWGSSIVVPVPFVPSMPGSSESFCVYGLESGTLYYFGIRTYDDATNESGISNIVSMRTQEAIVTDTIPPQWVYLELVEVGFDMVMLGWFASGDDIWDGVASHYLFALSDHNINAFNWDSLEHFLGPTPEPAGTYQRYIISGLEPGRTYYVACKVFDEAGNASRISNTVRFTTYSVDNIPPARITDLHIILCDESTIVLGWSAPGDDGHMGICSGYEIRYSLTPITPLTWSSAYELPNPPEPDVAGTAQTYTATGLRSGTRYCFGIRSYDDSGNISELSNIVCG
ncbi:MAG: fibronectin type III domain-containing protein, partial [Halobacteria archaeon]